MLLFRLGLTYYYRNEFLDESYFPYCAYPEEKESEEEIKNCPFHLRKGM